MPKYTVSDTSGKLVGVLDLLDSVGSNPGLVDCRIVPEVLSLEREIIIGWLLVSTPAKPVRGASKVCVICPDEPAVCYIEDPIGDRVPICEAHRQAVIKQNLGHRLVEVGSNNDRTDGAPGGRS